MQSHYDIIVIGAGHAGCEAAYASAVMGASTLLITMDLNKIAQMSCNPSVGGIAKGQIIREIDALGGMSAIITDASTLQFRMLNRSKGPAMWSPRAQCDRNSYSQNWRWILENTPGLYLWQDTVSNFTFSEQGEILSLETSLGGRFTASYYILTAGTFLNGRIFVGDRTAEGGRVAEPSSHLISSQLRDQGIQTSRMKTGTPPRVDVRSVNLSRLILQSGDESPEKFSYLPYLSSAQRQDIQQMYCYIAHTSPKVHEILRSGFDRSPLFSGKITGVGPRYCPSIEDKLRTFSDKDSHQIFLEPEGRNSTEYYLQGFSSSLPFEIQLEALSHVDGFDDVHLLRPAYAIEYDYFDPTQLDHTLRSKVIPNLYLAGQVNGTTGYEEAAAQGIVAGINAVLSSRGQEEFILSRDSSYIGVLIDDLVTKGVDEPYRMFTSRAEYRLSLRHDTADQRLTRKSYELGLATKERMERLEKKSEDIRRVKEILQHTRIGQKSAYDTLKEPEQDIMALGIEALGSFPEEILNEAELDIRYSGYIDRQERELEKARKAENMEIPADFDYDSVDGISSESREKLKAVRPVSIGQAGRISGVRVSDIAVLAVAVRSNGHGQ